MQPIKFKKHLVLALMGWLIAGAAFAQYPAPYNSTGTYPRIVPTPRGGNPMNYGFNLAPLLNTVQGSSFAHLWWFGDNGYGFLPQPTHAFYPLQNGKTTVIAVTTENYGSGGPPPIGSDIIPNSTRTNGPSNLPAGQTFNIQRFRNAVRGDTTYMIVNYAKPPQTGNGLVSGRLIINTSPNVQVLSNFYNRFPSAAPNGETFDPARPNEIIFNDLRGGMERSVLIPLFVDPMADGNVDVSVQLQIGNQQADKQVHVNYDQFTTPIARSHDPNQMSNASEAASICEYGNREINYTVDFQNVGKGRTHYVEVVCYLDPKLNMNSIDDFVLPKEYGNATIRQGSNGRYTPGAGPLYSINQTDHTITFEFNDLELHGTNMPGLTNLDLTRSAIGFSIRVKPYYVFGNPVISSAKITFDENDPIKTNETETTCTDPLPMNNGGGFHPPTIQDATIDKYQHSKEELKKTPGKKKLK